MKEDFDFKPFKRLTIFHKKWWKKKFKRIRRLYQWSKFHAKEYDWDYCYFIDMMIMKLTFMGTTIHNNNIIVGRKKVMNSIWAARKKLQNFRNAFDIAEERNKMEMIERFGQELKSKMVFKDSEKKGFHILDFIYSTDTLVSEEILEEMKKMDEEQLGSEYEIKKDMLNDFCNILKDNIFYWWD